MRHEKSVYHYLKLFWDLKLNSLLLAIGLAILFFVGYAIYPKQYTVTTEYYAENKANALNTPQAEASMIRLAGGYVFLGNSKNVQDIALQKSGLNRQQISGIKMEQAQKATFFKMTITADTVENVKKFTKEFVDVLYERGVSAQRTHEMITVTDLEQAVIQEYPKPLFLAIIYIGVVLAATSMYVLYMDYVITQRKKRYLQRRSRINGVRG